MNFTNRAVLAHVLTVKVASLKLLMDMLCCSLRNNHFLGDVGGLQLQLIGNVIGNFNHDLLREPSIEFLEFKVILFYLVHFYLWEQNEV